jgi:hypothetical protein
VTRLVALYPRDWRTRYEDEFLALLADRPPHAMGRLDIIRGALDARLHPQVKGALDPIEPPTPVNVWGVRAGSATLLGALLWILAVVVAANGPIIVEDWGTYRDLTAAAPLFFIAILLLCAGMVAVALDLPASAGVARAAATVGALVGLVWALSPWLLLFGLVMFGGLVVVGASAWRARRWSGIVFAIFLLGMVLPWTVVLIVGSGLWAPPELGPEVQYVVLGSLVVAWLVVGGSLVLPRRPGETVRDQSIG